MQVQFIREYIRHVLFHLFLKFLYISQFVQSHVCVNSVFLNIRVSNMGVACVKWVILGILFASSTPLYRLRWDATNVRSDEPGPHIDTISWWNRLYWIKFPWTIIGEVCTILFCCFHHSYLFLFFGNIRCLLLIDSANPHFGDIDFIKKATLIGVPPSFRQWLSPKSLTMSYHTIVMIHLPLIWWQINLTCGNKYI